MISLRFEGGQDLLKNLESLSTRVSRSIQREALRHGAEPLRAAMAAKAPHEPGKPDLRDSIVIGNAKGEDVNDISIAVGPTKAGYYGSFQEFGTAHHAAQPFARPAFDETWRKSLELIRQDIWTSLAARGIGQSASIDTPVIGGPGGGLT